MKTIHALALIFAVGFISCTQSEPARSQPPAATTTSASSSNFSNFATYLCSMQLPENLSFCGEKVPLDIPEVRERAEREFYVNLQMPGQLILNIKRSGRYFALFERIFKEEGVPDDLKYLALAESALFMARSPKDAVGLWQFIEGTARRYGLRVDDEVDERKHVEKSTRAAVAYLKHAYKQLGSWTLAAAAYNQGTDGTLDDVSFQNKNSYYDLFLNDETSRYILRIVVLKELMEHASSYGISINESEMYKAPSYTLSKEYNAIPDLSQWAQENGSSYKDVKILNPWIRRRSLPKPPKGGYWEIALPK